MAWLTSSSVRSCSWPAEALRMPCMLSFSTYSCCRSHLGGSQQDTSATELWGCPGEAPSGRETYSVTPVPHCVCPDRGCSSSGQPCPSCCPLQHHRTRGSPSITPTLTDTHIWDPSSPGALQSPPVLSGTLRNCSLFSHPTSKPGFLLSTQNLLRTPPYPTVTPGEAPNWAPPVLPQPQRGTPIFKVPLSCSPPTETPPPCPRTPARRCRAARSPGGLAPAPQPRRAAAAQARRPWRPRRCGNGASDSAPWRRGGLAAGRRQRAAGRAVLPPGGAGERARPAGTRGGDSGGHSEDA